MILFNSSPAVTSFRRKRPQTKDRLVLIQTPVCTSDTAELWMELSAERKIMDPL